MKMKQTELGPRKNPKIAMITNLSRDSLLGNQNQ